MPPQFPITLASLFTSRDGHDRHTTRTTVGWVRVDSGSLCPAARSHFGGLATILGPCAVSSETTFIYMFCMDVYVLYVMLLLGCER